VIAAKSFDHKGPYYVFADAGVAMHQTGQREIDRIKSELVAPEEPPETEREA
jgi:hypothetical protein